MEVTALRCPACCDKTFDSKAKLVEHLADLVSNITCPICTSKCSSYEQLIEHLTLDGCQHVNTTHTVLFDIQTTDNELAEDSNLNEQFSSEHFNDEAHQNNIDPLVGVPKLNGADDEDIDKMYVELLSKQMTKPCLQTQEMKLVKDNGVSRYFIMTEDDATISPGSTVVTKQNNDGTISLTTVKDMKQESETVITQETDPEDLQDELYSCNTCGVSFSSVLEHIQNYHNDQDVVVEDHMEENSGGGVTGQSTIADKPPRRVITDTGDIVETPFTSLHLVSNDANGAKGMGNEEEVVCDKDGRVYTRRYVQIDKFSDSFVKSIKPDLKNGRYHKVIEKEIKDTSGRPVKVYNCMTCDIYVANLNEFQSRPCKKISDKYKCSQCNLTYDNPKSLCAHMKAHKVKHNTTEKEIETKTIYECSICSTEFPTNKSLKLHKRMHDPIKARPIEAPVETADGTEVSVDKYICGVCGKLIPVDYKTVHQNSHKDTDQFNCDICNKKFTAYEYLEMHLNVHSTEKIVVNKQDKSSLPYTCSYCDRRFARPHEKVKHERIHTGEKPHSCEICGKSFRVSYCLTLHMRTHTGARPYACQHCGKRVESTMKLNNFPLARPHKSYFLSADSSDLSLALVNKEEVVRLSVEKSVPDCRTCAGALRFKAHSVYNHHLLTHSEVRAYKCPYCPKAFKTSVQLAGHKNSHTKPFSCQHCNRPFASLYAVRAHTETHARQNNLKFACQICGAKYARAFALKDHIKQAHGEQQDDSVVDNLVNITLKDDNWIMQPVGDAEIEEVPMISKDDQLEEKVLL